MLADFEGWPSSNKDDILIYLMNEYGTMVKRLVFSYVKDKEFSRRYHTGSFLLQLIKTLIHLRVNQAIKPGFTA